MLETEKNSILDCGNSFYNRSIKFSLKSILDMHKNGKILTCENKDLLSVEQKAKFINLALLGLPITVTVVRVEESDHPEFHTFKLLNLKESESLIALIDFLSNNLILESKHLINLKCKWSDIPSILQRNIFSSHMIQFNIIVPVNLPISKTDLKQLQLLYN